MVMATQTSSEASSSDAAVLSRKRGGRLLALGTVLAIVGAASLYLVVHIGRNHGPVLQISSAPLPQPTGAQSATLRATPEPVLAAAAAALLASPPAEARGRYVHIAIETWASEETDIRPELRKSWFDPATRRTYEQMLRLPVVGAASFEPAKAIGHTDFTHGEYADGLGTTPVGNLRPPLPDQPAAMLLQMMDDRGGQMPSATGAVEFVSGIYADTYPSVAVRAAALNTLASIDGLIVDPAASDWLGRPGISITGNSSDGNTSTVIINPADGMALASWTRISALNGAPQLWSLHLTTTRTDQRPAISG
ncbi:hypothetical protein AB0B66_39225 [Catellatospora sp. NPDC049111]|uniref:hypothetical protein n=1 Tax=Catellatospora sp. NPDC049111 TaxID=3155271 RepID=UPI00340E8F34